MNNQSATILDFIVPGSKFTKFLSFLKQKIFSSNFAPLFSIMSNFMCPVYFLAEILYTFSKRSLAKYKFGEISSEQLKV